MSSLTFDNVGYLASLIPPFNPLSISGCKLWVKADAGITKDGSDLVSNWADQSGNSNDLAQATGTNQPLYVANQYNGLPTIRFDGVDNYIKKQPLSGGAISQPVTIFIVCTSPSTSALAKIMFMAGTVSPATRCQFFKTDAPDTWGAYAGSAIVSGGTYSTGLAYFTIVYNGASSSARRNAASIFTGDPGSNNPNGMTLASQETGSTYAGMDYCEVLIYSGALSSTDRDKIENYLKGRWGL